MKPIKLTTPLTKTKIAGLKKGDLVLLSGTIYTARDQAHKKIYDAIQNKQIPPIPKGEIIYYTGPTPAKPGKIIGACGPTTSSRMDAFTPFLTAHGYPLSIGKGTRSSEVITALKKYHGIYFSALGGCGALYQTKVLTITCIAYPELLSEAVYKLEVKDFPLILIN
ncbi:TRZ/ATZ family protein [bacterium]|nr:TRZ/ATZ family protein [bacterium]MBT7088282.1 TRZ/ATZ family protein [bacterium]